MQNRFGLFIKIRTIFLIASQFKQKKVLSIQKTASYRYCKVFYQQFLLSMRTQYVSPKLLLQFYKGQKVPPLVTKYDFQRNTQQAIDKSQRRNFAHSSIANTNSNQEYQSFLVEKERELESEVTQNRELRLIIKELEEKLTRLVAVNAQLVERIQELEKRNKSLSEITEKQRREMNRKCKAEVYNDIQNYLRLSVEAFTEQMQQIKMSPIVQNKLQQLLQQILNINNLSVRRALANRKQSLSKRTYNQETENAIRQIVNKSSASKQKSKKDLIADRYEEIFQKLNRNTEPRPGTIITRQNVSPQPNRHFQTHSVRRTRIFNSSNISQEIDKNRSGSKDPSRRLDF